MNFKLCIKTIMALLVLLSCSKAKFSNGVEEDTKRPNVTEVQVETIPTSDSAVDSAMPQNPLFADCPLEPDRPIVADLYQLSPQTQMLPDYTQLISIKKICLNQLDIKARDFSDGFPGVSNLFEWFGLDMNFRVKLPETGLLTFKIIADDGANLYINN